MDDLLDEGELFSFLFLFSFPFFFHFLFFTCLTDPPAPRSWSMFGIPAFVHVNLLLLRDGAPEGNH